MKTYKKTFSDSPSAKYVCPECKEGSLVPEKGNFKFSEPKYSKDAHSHDAWDPDWITHRFVFTCVCDRDGCGELAFVSGTGGVGQRYDYDGSPEYYNFFRIRSFFPAPYLVSLPENAPSEVVELVEKSFSLFWIDTSAASNALRASLEALLDDLKIPRVQAGKGNGTHRLNLHNRIELWSTQQAEYAELCQALKEVGNLGSHGESVDDSHYFGILNIYSHVLFQLYENNAAEMKKLAADIRASIKKDKK